MPMRLMNRKKPTTERMANASGWDLVGERADNGRVGRRPVKLNKLNNNSSYECGR